jgi:hypothetical protein
MTPTPSHGSILEVDAECLITYTNGKSEYCQYCPPMKFADCGPGYGPGGHCPKYDHYHLMGRRKQSYGSIPDGE